MVYMYDKKINIMLYTILAIIGASFVFIPTDSLINFIFSIIGIIIVISNIIPCITYITGALTDKKYLAPAITYSIMVVLGLMFIFGWSYKIISILFSISLIILPAIRIVLAKFSKEVLKKELPYIVVGLIIFFIPFGSIIGILLKVLGGLIILYSIYMIILLLTNPQKKNKNKDDNENIIIDAKYRDL